MTLLKIKNEKHLEDQSEDRHVGIILPQRVHSYLTLYTYANSVAKTIVIKELLQNWMDSEGNTSEEELIKKIVVRTITIWKRKRAKDETCSLNQFKKQLIAEFQWRGLPIEIIKKILTGFNDGTN